MGCRNRVLVGLVLVAACSAPARQQPTPSKAAVVQPAAAANGLVRIADGGSVCMLSNRFFGARKTVPVEVAGKTYNGCCAHAAFAAVL